MSEPVDNLVLEQLRLIRRDLAEQRAEFREMVVRFGYQETMMARFGRDQSHMYEEQIMDRHAVDALRERIARIERRLEISDA